MSRFLGHNTLLCLTLHFSHTPLEHVIEECPQHKQLRHTPNFNDQTHRSNNVPKNA